MKPRVTDGLDGRSLFDVGYLGVFLEIFSSLPGLATMFPFFSPDRQTMSSSSFLPFFLGGSFAGRNGKSQKIDESAFYINIFKEISFLGFTRWQAIMRYAFKCGTKMNSRLNFCRERKRERDVCARTRVPLMKLHLINCLFRVSRCRTEARRGRWSCGRTSQRTMQICFEGIACFVKRGTARPTFNPPFSPIRILKLSTNSRTARSTVVLRLFSSFAVSSHRSSRISQRSHFLPDHLIFNRAPDG